MREIQANPDGYLDLWARGHFKSSGITFGLSLQDILNDPEVTIGIFSHTRPIAKGFLRQLKREMEGNEFLKALFPDILFKDPKFESPKWSEDDGLIVKRVSNPKESTVEAWGLVDGQPTSRHFKIRVYDDIVTRESVTTPDMIAKVNEAWELSTNLGSTGGKQRYAGTRYHFNDSYSELIRRGVIKTRIYPATVDGTVEGDPVLLSREDLKERRAAQGPYTFACLPGDAPILMSDFTERTISELKVGDEVVGYTFPPKRKAMAVIARVTGIGTKIAPVWEIIAESGRVIRCTAEHKWYTGRRGKDIGGTDNHNGYASLILCSENRRPLGHLTSYYDPRKINAPYDPHVAGWLGGFFDGEGSVSGGTVHFSQTEKWPAIIPRLQKSLTELNLPWKNFLLKRKNVPAHWHRCWDHYLVGGRDTTMRFLNICKPAKAKPILDGMYSRNTANFDGKNWRDKVVSRRCIGDQLVFSIETTTGNYVAYGYVSKNSQMLLNPLADETQGFKTDWFRHYSQKGDGKEFNRYIIVDPANAKKRSSDYTTMFVIGLGMDENYYIIDMVRDRLNLTERTKALMTLHKRYRPKKVGYEEYGMISDVQHIKDKQNDDNYRFEIVHLGGRLSKIDRIRRLVPLFESGRIFFPESIYRTNYEGKTVELVQAFIEEEYKAFPVGLHDDMLDALSRILDDDMEVIWPKPIEEPDRYARKYMKKTPTSWMAV